MKRNEENLHDIFWYNVDDVLAKKHKTLSEMAEATEIKYPTMSSWRARKRLPDLISTADIASYLGVSIESLLGSPLQKDLGRQLSDLAKEATAKGNEDVVSAVNRMSAILNEIDGLIKGLKDEMNLKK